MNSKPPIAARQGFTLLEMMIASGLTATLMVLVWSLFGIYTKLNDKGARQATELQLLRALTRQIRTDLEHLVNVATPPPALSSTSTTTMSLASRMSAATATPASTLPAMRGTNTRLEFVIRAPRSQVREPNSTTNDREQAPVAEVYDLVSYEFLSADPLVTPNDSLGGRDQSVNSSPGEELLDEEPQFGLTRRLTPWLPEAGQGDSLRRRESLDEEAAPSETTDYVPEVSSFRLRYFDGKSWGDEWTGVGPQRWPVAIEVAFDLRDPEEETKEQDAPPTRPLAQREAPSVVGFDAAVSDPGDDFFEAEYRFIISVDALRPTPSLKSEGQP